MKKPKLMSPAEIEERIYRRLLKLFRELEAEGWDRDRIMRMAKQMLAKYKRKTQTGIKPQRVQ